MKKVFLLIAACVFACVANAQIIIGAEIGMNWKSNSSRDGGIYSAGGTVFSDVWVTPSIGYVINDKFMLGVYGDWERTDNIDKTALSKDLEKMAYKEDNFLNLIGAGVYARYTAFKVSRMSLFVEGTFDALFGKDRYKKTFDAQSGDDVSSGGLKHGIFTVSVTPGVNYAFNEHLSADVFVDIFAITYSCHQTKDSSKTDKIDYSRRFDFLSTDDGVISLGFNYKF